MHAEGFDLDLALRRSPAAAGARGTRARQDLLGYAEESAGRGVVDQPPADGRFMRGRGLRQTSAVLVAEHAGVFAAAAPLKRPDGVGGMSIAFLGAEPVETAEPDQIGDGETLSVWCIRQCRGRVGAMGLSFMALGCTRCGLL